MLFGNHLDLRSQTQHFQNGWRSRTPINQAENQILLQPNWNDPWNLSHPRKSIWELGDTRSNVQRVRVQRVLLLPETKNPARSPEPRNPVRPPEPRNLVRNYIPTPRTLGSSLSIRGSHRVSKDMPGRENLKIFADFRHSSWFSWGIRISIVLGSSPDAPIVIRMTNINFIRFTSLPYFTHQFPFNEPPV